MLDYQCTPTGLALHNATAFLKMIVGPYGSGKSTAIIMDMLYNAMNQTASPDGVRYTRWGVVRRSYPNLKASTLKLLQETLPAEAGTITISGAPFIGRYRFSLPDNTIVQMELDIWALEMERSLQNIGSSNWTGAWINEASEISFDVLGIIASRPGRYPTLSAHGVKCKWAGVYMDFNPLPATHWLKPIFNAPELRFKDADGKDQIYPIAAFSQPPAAFKVVQPDGRVTYRLNPDAENLSNLDDGYYARQIALRDLAGRHDEIDSLYCMLEVNLYSGRQVWSNFKRDRHVANAPIEPIQKAPLVVGFDSSGLNPAVVVLQFQYGRWCVLDELIGEDMGLELFLDGALIPFFPQRYPGSKVVVSYDPSNTRDSWTAVTPSTRLKEAGFELAERVTNRLQPRLDAVTRMLNMDYGGLIISPTCVNLIKAMEGDYHYTRQRLKGSMEYAYSKEPAKNASSHIADALQYGVMHIQRPSDGGFSEVIRDTLRKRNKSLRNILRVA
jgi:hypothetical protein